MDKLSGNLRRHCADRRSGVAQILTQVETRPQSVKLLYREICYYLTNYFDTVAQHWRDFAIVPMAANLQLVLFRSRSGGKYYVRASLNERPVPLLPNSEDVYVPWSVARDYMMRCLPLEMQ